MRQRCKPRAFSLALLGLLFCSTPLRAQVQLGSETQLNLDGSISAGYGGGITNEGPDSHGLTFGGTGNLNGSYYSPQFLSFDVVPFYNQSRNNSTYQSLTDSSGVNAAANIFGGSQFPGYVNYSRIYNSESNNYVLPGLANYATNGNTQTFGVGWSAHFRQLPSLNVGYQQGNSDYSIYGTPEESASDSHSVFGSASYNLDGFHLNGGVHYATTHSVIPDILSGDLSETESAATTTYTFNASRAVFLDGSTWANFTRTSASYDALGLRSSETADVVTGGLSLKPTSKLSTIINFDYDDNLAGSIFQEVTSTGAVVPVSLNEAPSHSWGLAADAQYSILSSLYVDGMISHRQQLFLGTAFDSTGYGGSLNFGHHLAGGQFSAGTTVTETSYGSNGDSMLGVLSNAAYFRRIGEWQLNGSMGYSRNAQTILITYTSSGYSYSVSANHRIGRLYWNGGASGSESTFKQDLNFTSHMQAYSTGLSSRWLSVNGAYAKSTGTGLITPTGVAPLPPGVPPELVPGVLYTGTTYSVSVGSTPVHGLTFSGTYLDSTSNTGSNGSLTSNNKTEQAFAYLNYRFRKVYFNAGYSRLLQGFSASGIAPTMVSSYYFGVSRWFKAF